MKIIIILGIILSVQPAFAKGTIERACNKIERKAATPRTCNCLQYVANVKLSRSEQHKVAKFFKNPDLVQKLKLSNSRTNQKFWQRYKEFGSFASKTCTK